MIYLFGRGSAVFSEQDFLPREGMMCAESAIGTRHMLRAFTDHPESVGETYFEHMHSASWFAARNRNDQ